MPDQHKTTPLSIRSQDRHAEKPLSLRLGAERIRVEEAARRAGLTVRRWLLDAVREKLDREQSGSGTSTSPGN